MVDSMTCDGKFTDQKSGYSVIFDDDGRVAYAYLINPEGKITADVWLYNRCETPFEPEWPDPEKMPFANPVDYSKDHADFISVDNISDVAVDWSSNSTTIEAIVIIREKQFAILVDGAKPGWCCMARKDGPLAKVLENQ